MKNRPKVSIDLVLASYTFCPLGSLTLVLWIVFVDPQKTFDAVRGTCDPYLDRAIHVEQNRSVRDRLISESRE